MQLPENLDPGAGAILLTPALAGGLRYDHGRRDYGRFRSATAIPLLAKEFAPASRFYPIVMVGDERIPVAVMGLQTSGNLFINPSDGAFHTGGYVPACLRAWPFALGRADTLVADIGASCFTGEGGLPLFEGETPSETFRDLVTFLTNYRAEREATQTLVSLLTELDLVEEKNAKVNLGEDRVSPSLATFWSVSKERLKALDGAALERLNLADALEPIFAHLSSSQLWWPLIARAAKAGKG